MKQVFCSKCVNKQKFFTFETLALKVFLILFFTLADVAPPVDETHHFRWTCCLCLEEAKKKKDITSQQLYATELVTVYQPQLSYFFTSVLQAVTDKTTQRIICLGKTWQLG